MDTNPEVEVAEVAEADAAAFFDKMFAEQPEADEAPEPVEQDEDEADEDAEGDEPADESEDGESKDQAPEAEEVELDGAKYAVPKPVAEVVKKAHNLQADYTRKTQEVAETRRVVEDRAQYLEAKEQLLGKAFSEAAELHAIQQQLKAYEAVNWRDLIEQDAQQALRLQVARQELSGKLQERQSALQQATTAIQQAQVAHRQKQMELGQQELTRRLGTLKDTDRGAMLEAAKELGFEEGDMLNPRALHALHLASKYLALQKSKPAVQKKVNEAKPMKPPVSRSTPKVQREGMLNDLADKARKTGRDEYAAAFFERKFGRN